MRRGSPAFTLIETIYSTLVFALIVIAIFNLYPSSFVAIRRGEATLEADALAQAVLEDIRSRNYASFTAGGSLTPAPTPWIYESVTYTPNVTIFRPPGANTSVNYVMGFNVTVTWSIQNVTHSVTHETYVQNVHR